MAGRLLVGLVLVLLSALPVGATELLVNGSFESGPPPFSVHDIGIAAGSSAIPGWTILGGGVDLLEDPWDVFDGVRAIDLDLQSPGGRCS